MAPRLLMRSTVMIALLIAWVMFAIGVGVYATSRGRDFVPWTVIALLISPLVCAVILAVGPDLSQATPATTAPAISAATASELLGRIEVLFERGALTDGDLARLRALAAREMPRPTSVEARALSSEFTRPCPGCGGLVHPQASTCMHCWAKLPRAA